MALQSLANGMGMLLDSCMMGNTLTGGSVTLNAAGESFAAIGEIYIEGEPASKTISSSGGKIFFRTGAVTFANAGTNFRVGIQDLAASGLEDGTYDVYADFVGGGGGIAANTWYEKAMTNGSKTINHLQKVAVIFETTARAGSDTIDIGAQAFRRFPSALTNFPYGTIDSGAGPARSASVPLCVIIFDDGTIGWVRSAVAFPGMTATSTNTFNSGSTPDEYAAVFQVPFKCSVDGVFLYIGSIASTDNFEMLLYSDAQGSPTVERTVTVDPNLTGSTITNAAYDVSFSSFELSPGIWYAIAVRPTTANSINVAYFDMTATFGNTYKKGLPFGTNCKLSSRTNKTGAFSEVQTYYQPIFGLWINKLDDAVQTPVEHSFTF